ncbi:MAG: S-layer homology domain-containing protein [Clostridiales bacterium]|nr:S-layer homology domain-containing protein [Clostridiales bacterium]
MKNLKASIAKVLVFVIVLTTMLSSMGMTAFGATASITMNFSGSVPSSVYFGNIKRWNDIYLSLADFEENSRGVALFAAKDSTLQEWDAVYYTGESGRIAFSNQYIAVTSNMSLIFSSNARNWRGSSLPTPYGTIQNLYSIGDYFYIAVYNMETGTNVLLQTADFENYNEVSSSTYPPTSPNLDSANIVSTPKHPLNQNVTIRIGSEPSFVPYIYWGSTLIHPRITPTPTPTASPSPTASPTPTSSPTPTPTPRLNDFNAVKFVPFSQYVDDTHGLPEDAANIRYRIYTENYSLPNDLVLNEDTGEISGIPKEAAISFLFNILVSYDSASSSGLSTTSSGLSTTSAGLSVLEEARISVADNLDTPVLQESDPGYEFVTPDVTDDYPQLAGTIRTIEDHVLKSEGEYLEFQNLYIDGVLQTPIEDYESYPGSTKIVIKAQTIARYGEGSHTVAATFLSAETGTLKRAAMNYTLDLSKPPVTEGSATYTSSRASATTSGPLSRTVKASVNGKTATAILTARLLKEAGDEGDAITVTSPLGTVVVDAASVKDIGFTTDVVVTYTVEALASGAVDISADITRKGTQITTFGKGIITISIPYALPNGVNWTQVVPYRKVNDSLELVMGGYNVGTKNVDLYLRHLSDYAIRVSDKKYEGRGGWYDESLDWAVQRGLFDKFIVDGGINAAQDVSRADFVVALLKSLGIQTLDSYKLNQFSDVSGENAEYILTARQLGIVSGVGNNLFDPNSTSKRGEQFQIVYNLIQADLTSVVSQNTNRKISDFKDSASVPQWLNPALTELLRLGVVQGDGTNLNVGDNFSIGQISVVLQKMASPKATA